MASLKPLIELASCHLSEVRYGTQGFLQAEDTLAFLVEAMAHCYFDFLSSWNWVPLISFIMSEFSEINMQAEDILEQHL